MKYTKTFASLLGCQYAISKPGWAAVVGVCVLGMSACFPLMLVESSSGSTSGMGGSTSGMGGSTSETGTGGESSATGTDGGAIATGTGGRGGSGSIACATPKDCPGSVKICETKVCASMTCSVTPTAAGNAANSQYYGDCRLFVCDVQGNLSSNDDLTDIYDDGNECTVDYCVNGVTEHSNNAAGTPCSTGYCDLAINCVDCVSNTNCVAPKVCKSGKCVPQMCSNSTKDGDETDTDCGGSCSPCGNNKACSTAFDCQNNVCASGVCASPTCQDGARNGLESDVDCGAPGCLSCGDGQTCRQPGDCVSGVCVVGKCVAPSCIDDVKNGGETGTDCGGTCASCN